MGDLVEIIGTESYDHSLMLGEICRIRYIDEEDCELISTERECYQHVHISEIKPYDNSYKYFFIEH